MSKKVYLLKIASFNNTTDRFEFYRDEAFTSKVRINKAIENMIDCNNGYNINTEEMNFSGSRETHITYSCMSAPEVDGERKSMRIRYVVKHLTLNYGF